MKIYLIRHGQTTGDIENRYGGDYDDHLTALGEAQAQNLAEELVPAGIEAIFTSPLLRATETAAIISKQLGVGFEIIEELRERNRYGLITGMTKAEATLKFPEIVRDVAVFANTVEGAEDFDSFKGRIIGAFNELLKRSFATIAVITHGGPLRVLAMEVLGAKELKDRMEDCGWALLHSDAGGIAIEKTKGFLI